MPGAALRECRVPRCPHYAGANGYCAEHGRKDVPVSQSPSGSGRYANNHRRFRFQRRAFLQRHPICAGCGCAPATELDHIQPHRGDARLFWDQHNWQGLCASCHGRKSAREVQCGRSMSDDPPNAWRLGN